VIGIAWARVDQCEEVSMTIAQAGVGFFDGTSVGWSASWAWGLPLVVLTVLMHVLGLGLMGQRLARVIDHMPERRHPMAVFAFVMGTATLLATTLHAVEAGIWAFAYGFLGALPDLKSAMLYSLNAITSYGHEGLLLESHWRLMGAIEALNGWLLFGLSTAFLFGVIQKIWILDRKQGGARKPE